MMKSKTRVFRYLYTVPHQHLNLKTTIRNLEQIDIQVRVDIILSINRLNKRHKNSTWAIKLYTVKHRETKCGYHIIYLLTKVDQASVP